MNQNEVVKTEMNALDENTVTDLTQMVAQSLLFYKQTSPVYERIAKAVLGIFDNENELANLEHKDLFKLLELSQKAMIQPVETLVKLVQNINALYERSQLAVKMDSLAKVVQEIQAKNEEHQEVTLGKKITIDAIDE
jgi:hypothetical protein